MKHVNDLHKLNPKHIAAMFETVQEIPDVTSEAFGAWLIHQADRLDWHDDIRREVMAHTTARKICDGM